MERSSSHLKVVARLGLVFMWNRDDSLLVGLGQVGAATCGRRPPEREGVLWVRGTGKAGRGWAPSSQSAARTHGFARAWGRATAPPLREAPAPPRAVTLPHLCPSILGVPGGPGI